ncbi:unnamed protein product [Prunus armeniaca]|uniref:Bet v I/Major latex protein domain-containing protein n=1 Tax=Prunus armeniaca TaxID=36596 RepID=A0A6J5X5Z7_PRUAR|nr:unnamed protein product [Prunus armeniaca]
MAQIANIEVQDEINANANKFYEIFRSKGYLLPKICPNIIKDLQVLKSDGSSVDSIKQWTYIAAREVTKHYKSFKATVQVTIGGDGCSHSSSSSVKWNIEYQKQNEAVPTPNKYLDFVVILTDKVDAYLLNNA